MQCAPVIWTLPADTTAALVVDTVSGPVFADAGETAPIGEYGSTESLVSENAVVVTSGVHAVEHPPSCRYQAVALNGVAVDGASNVSFSLVPSCALASQKMNS